MIKFFADTASLPEIQHSFDRQVNDGITTNPLIMVNSGDLSGGAEAACKQILERYAQVPVSIETDLGGIPVADLNRRRLDVANTLYQQGLKIASWGSNAVVKIPICRGGLDATRLLAEKGIKTNVTACMSPYQALEAADAGATFVSLFANRMLDSHILELSGHRNLSIILDSTKNWKDVVKAGKEAHTESAWKRTLDEIAYTADVLRQGYKSELIVGSIRSPQDITRLVQAGPHIITIPYGIMKDLVDIPGLKSVEGKVHPAPLLGLQEMDHPMTIYTIKEFEAAADKYRKT